MLATSAQTLPSRELRTWFGWDAAPEELHWDMAGKAFTGPENLFSGGKPLFYNICLSL